MEYQRDKVTFNVVKRLLTSLYKAFLFRVLGKKEQLEWQQILIADCLRIIGFSKLAYWFTYQVKTSTSNRKHKFWSLHVLGLALQYAGNMKEAEEAFLESQAYGCELSLSFSLQHLGKLNVELGNYEQADRQFAEALNIRKNLKRSDLVDSTKCAIKGLQQLRMERVTF